MNEKKFYIRINADDFGMCDSVNLAIDRCFKKALIDSTTIMVNMPAFQDAVKLSECGRYKSRVGLHLNLVEGKPLTKKIENTFFCDGDGFFNRSIMTGLNRVWINNYTKACIEEEIEAQMHRYINYGFDLMHMDSHMHAHVNLSILEIVLNLAQKYEFNSIRLARNIPDGQIGFFKRGYKRYINSKIINFNKNERRIFRHFGSIEDVEKQSQIKGLTKYDVEIMVHPVLVDDCICDAINPIGIEEWERVKMLDLNFI